MEVWDGRGFSNDKPKKGKSIADVKREYPIERILALLGGGGDSYYAGIRNRGDWASIPCPLHLDRRPSASVHLAKGRFRCHSCGVAGDVVDVVQQVHGFSEVREAVEWIISHG